MASFIFAASLFDFLPELEDNEIDAVVTDPPYELGFMGKKWDASGVAFNPATWAAVLRVMKPGAHLLAFSGTRTYHRMVCAIEDAGFEIRDQLAWMYGSGFPKSLDVSKAIDESLTGIRRGAAGALISGNGSMSAGNYEHTPKGDPISPEGTAWAGWGTALKPAQEPIVLARKPLIGTVAANVLAHGTGGINVDGCRIGTDGGGTHCTNRDEHGKCRGHRNAGQSTSGETFHGPDTEGGRWPANVILDEVAGAVLDEQSGQRGGGFGVRGAGSMEGRTSFALPGQGQVVGYGDSGGASRFFYCAKASRSEREAGLDHLPIRSGGELTNREDGSDGLKSPRAGAGRGGGRRNHHPTVKPIELMRYLIRLITPPGGIVLDPFTGSGTTHVAAKLEGFDSVGCDLSPEYVEIANARVDAVRGATNP